MTKVSIVIPSFNAQKYIGDTVQSVLNQSFQDFEIIIINDGSTDGTEAVIKNISDGRIHYTYKVNTGVSDSRNIGLSMATGEYLVFLDADDILSKRFLETRVSCLDKEKSLGFCCGEVKKIDENGNALPGSFRGPSKKILEEILLYHPDVITCPSNFMIRKNILTDNNILFNRDLSSCADRFFLIELSNKATGDIIHQDGELYYRVHNASMSTVLTQELLEDNLKYVEYLIRQSYVPSYLKNTFNFKNNYIFAGANYQLKNYYEAGIYTMKAFVYNPVEMIKKLLNKF